MDIETPARKAIRLLGVKRIAAACKSDSHPDGLTTDAVHKWAQRRGGLIPAEHQGSILDLARVLGQAMTAEDVIGRPGGIVDDSLTHPTKADVAA